VKTTSRRIFAGTGAASEDWAEAMTGIVSGGGAGKLEPFVRWYDDHRTTFVRRPSYYNPCMASATLHHPKVEELQLEGVLHALSDPIRLQMVRELARRDEPCACGSIDVPVSKSTRTHHWRVLRENGVIRQVERGTAKLTELRREDLDVRFPGLIDVVLRERDAGETATSTASLRA
jgi:DNA-binding transcriptional ArsR family regulator